MKLVLIEWVDSRSSISGWRELDDLKSHDVGLMRSVGWLLQNTRKLVQIVPHLGDNPEQGCGDMTIPKSQVKKIVYLKE